MLTGIQQTLTPHWSQNPVTKPGLSLARSESSGEALGQMLVINFASPSDSSSIH